MVAVFLLDVFQLVDVILGLERIHVWILFRVSLRLNQYLCASAAKSERVNIEADLHNTAYLLCGIQRAGIYNSLSDGLVFQYLALPDKTTQLTA